MNSEWSFDDLTDCYMACSNPPPCLQIEVESKPSNRCSLFSDSLTTLCGNIPIFLLISSSGTVIMKSSLSNDLFTKPFGLAGSKTISNS